MEELINMFFETENKEEKEKIRTIIINTIEEENTKIDFDVLMKIVDTMSLAEVTNLSKISKNTYVAKAAYMIIETRIDDYRSKEFVNSKRVPENKVKFKRRTFYGKYKK